MPTGACSDAVFSSAPFFHSSREDNKHQQPDIISIGEDKEYLLMTTNISAFDFCVCNWKGLVGEINSIQWKLIAGGVSEELLGVY